MLTETISGIYYIYVVGSFYSEILIFVSFRLNLISMYSIIHFEACFLVTCDQII